MEGKAFARILQQSIPEHVDDADTGGRETWGGGRGGRARVPRGAAPATAVATSEESGASECKFFLSVMRLYDSASFPERGHPGAEIPLETIDEEGNVRASPFLN